MATMKHLLTKTLGVVTILAATSMGAPVHAETVDTRIGKLDFELGVPTKETVAKLYDELDFQRACQLYLWALPAVDAAQTRLYSAFAAVHATAMSSSGKVTATSADSSPPTSPLLMSAGAWIFLSPARWC
jgi:hypothetical protein